MPIPEAHAHAAARYRRPNLRYERDLVENVEGPRDAIVFLQTIEHIAEVDRLLDAIATAAPVAYISTPNRLTLAPEGAEKSDNPWHLREYTATEYRELLRAALFIRFRSSACATPASCASTVGPWRSAGTGFTGAAPDWAVLRSVHAGDQRLRLQAAGGRPRRLPRLPRDLPTMSGAAPAPPQGHAGDIAIVLHSHMPYVEGFGTYPFGEEWLFDAVIRSHLPVLAIAERLTMTVTPVLADQLEAPGVAARMLAFAGELRRGSAELDAADMTEPRAARGVPRRGRPLRRRDRRARAPRRRSARSFRRGRGRGRRADRLERHARDPAAAGDARGRDAADRDRPALARAALRPERRLLAARVRLRARSRAAARRGRRALDLRRSERARACGRRDAPDRPRPGDGAAARLGGDPVAVVALPATPPTRCTRTSTTSRCGAAARGRSAALPTSPSGRPNAPASRLGSSPPRPPCGCASTGNAPAAPACSPSRSTPSCSATGGGRVRSGSAETLAQLPAHGVRPLTISEAVAEHPPERRPARRCELGRGQGPAHLGWPSCRRPARRRAPARAAPAARARGGTARPGGGAGRARAARVAGERLGLPRLSGPGRRLPLRAGPRPQRGVLHRPRSCRPGGRRGAPRPRSRPRAREPVRALTPRPRGPGPGSLRRSSPGRLSDSLRHARAAPPAGAARPSPACRVSIDDASRTDPLLGIPAADRGRPGAPRAQALRGARRARDRGPRPHPRRRRVAARGGPLRRPHPPGDGAEPPARPRRVRRLGRAHERRHARRRGRARRPLRVRRRARSRLARRGRLRAPRAPLRGAACDDDPRHRAWPSSGLGRQASAVPHPRCRALDREPLRPRDRLLVLHARADLRHLRRARAPRHA